MATRWTQEEEEYLIAKYEISDIDIIQKVLKRTPESIEKHYKRLRAKDLTNPEEIEFFMRRAGRTKPKQLRRRKIKGTKETATLASWSGKGNPYRHTRSGYRPDLDLNVRSGWEANVIRILKSYDIPYEFEPRVFTFPVKRGNKSYLPDIYLPTEDGVGEWIEVKGYLDKNSQVKLKRFKKYYPKEFSRLTMIIGKSSKAAQEFCLELDVPIVLNYEEISKAFKPRIKTWEGR